MNRLIMFCLLLHDASPSAITGPDGVTVENDSDICYDMCHTNYSDIVEECRFGCDHRSGIRERLNPFTSCLGSCETRFRENYYTRTNDTDFINRGWEACLNACRLPYKTKIRWNVYIDLRSGEPIWNFERIITDGRKISNVAMEYEDLISTVALRKNHFFMDPSSKLRFPNLNVYDADSRTMQIIMMEMLDKVRQEISSIAPRRFDGISSIDYVGPRLVEHGPHGPVVKDITELQYRPKEVLIYKGMVFNLDDFLDHSGAHHDERVILIYFMLMLLLSFLLCGCLHLRKYRATLNNYRLRRAAPQVENDDWTKRIPTTGDAPPCYTPSQGKISSN